MQWQIVKWVRSASLVALLVIGCGIVVSVIFLAKGCVGDCETSRTALGANGESAIVRVDEACGGLGGSNRVTLVLERRLRPSVEVLTYGPAYSFTSDPQKTEPRVVWTSPKLIEVSIPVVSFVEFQRDAVGDVVIRFTFGEVIYK